MTLERTIPEMIGEGHTAVRTLKGVAAIRTEDKIGKPSAIEKEETLFLIFDIFLKGCPHFFREKTPFLPHVHHLHPRKGLSFDPLREIEETKLSSFSVIK
jgi:hypothetical protein